MQATFGKYFSRPPWHFWEVPSSIGGIYSSKQLCITIHQRCWSLWWRHLWNN